MAIRYLSGINVDSNTLFVDDANNRVGIGTASPQRALNIVSNNAQIRISDSTAPTTNYWEFSSIFFNTNQDLFISNQSGTAITINASLNVGIGTGTPGHRLDVNGDVNISNANVYRIGGNTILAGTTSVAVGSSGATGSVTLRTTSGDGLVLNGSNVGIGTTSPSYKLDVSGDIRSTTINLGTQGVNVSSYGFLSQTLSGQMTFLGHNVRASSTVNNTALVVNGGWISSLIKQYYNEGITFHTSTTEYAAGATYPLADTERMRITSAGNVGIGTTSPNQKLDVNGTIGIKGAAFATNDATYTSIFKAQSNSVGIYLGGAADPSNYYDNDYHYFRSSGAVSTLGVWNATGLGVGTTSPSQKLDVVGNAKISADILLGTAGVSNNIYFADATSTQNVRINSYTDNTLFFDNFNGQYNFRTTNSYVSRLYIANGGNVGIGTTSPTEILELSTTTDPKIRFVDVGNTDAKIGIVGSTALGFEVNGSERMRIASTGATRLNAYGSGSFTGTVAYNLAVDSSGNIIETAGGVVDGSGTANYVSKWQDANTLTISQLFDNGTDVGIGTSSPFVKFDVRGEAMLLYRPAGNAYAIYSAANNTYSWQLGINNGSDFIITGGGFTGLGTERLRITSDGNVGIGTTSPSYKLDVNGDVNIPFGTSNGYRINGNRILSQGSGFFEFGALDYKSTYPNISTNSDGTFRIQSNGSTLVTVNQSGNVGIGTTAPGSKLEVFDGDISVTTGGTFSFLNLNRNFIPNSSGVLLGGTKFRGYSTGTTYQSGVHVYGYSTEAWTSTSSPGYLSIQTTPSGSTTPVERMVVTSAGNVGIGTSAPSRTLSVGGTNAYMDFKASSFRTYTIGSDGNGFIVFDDNASAYRMVVNPSGNVGIGTTSPSSMLTLNGVTPYIRLERGGAPTWEIRQNYPSTEYGFQVVNVTNSNIPFFIGESSNVGIGTTSPSKKLQIAISNSAHVDEGILLQSPSGYGEGAIYHDYGQSNGITAFKIWNTYTGSQIALSQDTYSSTGSPGSIRFYTSAQGTANAPSERMRITSAGNVGIGVTSTSAKLESYQSAVWDGSNYAIKANHYSTFNGIRINGQDQERDIYQENTSYGIGIATSGAQPIKFLISNSSEIMRVAGNGNVGIGMTSPNSKLVIARDVTDNDLSQFGYVQLKLIGATTSAKQLLLGFETENNYGFIQTLQDGASWTAYNLALQWKGGNVGIGTKSPVVKTHIVGPTLTTTSETTYPLWLSDTGDTTKALILGFDLANDVGVIQAVDQAVAWKDVCIAPTAAAVGIGNVAPSQKLHVTGNIRVTGAYYDSSNSAGSSGQVLSSTGSGTAWVNQGEATATSLFDLLPAARTTYAWSVQLTAGTWADIFSSNTVLSNGTWMVQVYVDDWAVGGQQYQETYSGIMSWGSANTTNQGGAAAISEIVLHRSGHAANAGNFYLRTVERVTSTLLLQGMSNQTYSAASTINFKFVKIF